MKVELYRNVAVVACMAGAGCAGLWLQSEMVILGAASLALFAVAGYATYEWASYWRLVGTGRPALQLAREEIAAKLNEELAICRLLPQPVHSQLTDLTADFLARYPIDGEGSFVVSDNMRVAMAGQACLLRIGIPQHDFRGVRRIRLHAGPFQINGEECFAYDEGWLIRFSWATIASKMQDHRETWQLVLLRLADNLARGSEWHAVERRFQECLQDYFQRCDAGRLMWWEWNGVVDARHLFRTLSDDFFCRPFSLRQDLPALYEAFRAFYRADPVTWIEQRHAELAAQPFPDEWQQNLERNVKHYRRLPPDLKQKIHGLIHIFLAEIQFDKQGVQRITDKMKLSVAAEACILILNRSMHDYRRVRLVEIWKGKPPDTDAGADWGGDASATRVRLDWESTKTGMSDPGNNYNPTMHEFAHILDHADDNLPQSIPVSAGSPNREVWERLVDEEFESIRAAYASGRGHVIKRYALQTYTDERFRAELFSCATEAFFERSVQLRQACPNLYAWLKSFYRLDPIDWARSP